MGTLSHKVTTAKTGNSMYHVPYELNKVNDLITVDRNAAETLTKAHCHLEHKQTYIVLVLKQQKPIAI